MRIRRDGTWARKSLGARTSEEGRRFARYSEMLAAAGMRTPVAVYNESTNELVFPWLVGTSARELLRRYIAEGAGPGWDRVPTKFFAALLKPLGQLHNVDPKGVNVTPLDPWRRIHPRLRKRARAANASFLTDAREVYRELRDVMNSFTGHQIILKQVPVHGDYHVGQLLFETPSIEPWLLDVDDVALGPPESDLGNFIAHLVTDDLRMGDLLDGFARLEPLLRHVYEELTGSKSDSTLINTYGAIALLRRSLKLHEKGTSPKHIESILSTAHTLANGAGAKYSQRA